ncbi:MAG TPA: hypothetical protein VFX30_12725 [bacterium]|nr:hypothetical protein [bacterium]
MTIAFNWRDGSLSPEALRERFRSADRNGNGWLLDASDRLPAESDDPAAGVLLTNPALLDRYRRLMSSTASAGSDPIAVRYLMPDASVTRIDPADIAELMRQNGGNLLRVADLARVYPNAQIGGAGETLRRLAARTIRSHRYPAGASLGDAYLDPGGDLIISHFYRDELRDAAPRFAQFMTNRGSADPDCYRRDAFTVSRCAPDSWPLDLDTMLSMASLEIDPSTPAGYATATADRRTAVLTALRDSGLASVSSRRVGDTSRILLDLRGDSARELLTFLNGRPENLLCDPANADQLAAYLGVPPASLPRDAQGRPTPATLRRALVAVLDDPNASVAYLESEANDPAAFNRAAVHPTLHFVARLSPQDLSQVVFGIYHIDAQSYQPRGQPLLDEILGPSSGRYQHQGESEPIFLRYTRSETDATLTMDRAYLGNHFVAEPVSPSDYRSGTVAVAYGSGGRILMRDERTYEPGAMMSRGGRVVAGVGLTTVTRIFPYFEAYPGRADTAGSRPSAAVFRPDRDGTLDADEYRMRIEGEDGDFLPTRLLTHNGRGEGGPNGVGYPFLRGARSVGMDSEHNRLETSLFAFLERQDGYRANHEMGRVSSLALEAGPSWMSSANASEPGFQLTIRHDVNTLFHLDQVGAGPLAVGGYAFLPWDWLANPYIPQFRANFISQPGFDPRWRVDVDLAELRAGVVFGGLQIMGQGRFGGDFGGTGTFRDVHAGLYLAGGGYLLYQRDWWEVGAGYEYFHQLTNPPEVTNASGAPYAPGSHNLFGRFAVRFDY